MQTPGEARRLSTHPTRVSTGVASGGSGPLCFVGPSSLRFVSTLLFSGLTVDWPTRQKHPSLVLQGGLFWSQAPDGELADPFVT